MAVNSSDHDFAPGSFVVKQKNEVVKPMVFDDGDAEPVSKFGGRGAAPVSYGGLPKGLHQVLYERGLAPRTLAGKQIATSTNARCAAVLDFLETEGRHNSKYSRTDYCQHCTKFDEETGEVIVKKNAAEQAAGVQIKLEDEAGSSIDSDESTDPDSLIECTYCNLCFHVHCCDHTTGRQVAAGGVVGAWPCPDCIEHAETQLNLEPLISQDAGASEDKPVDLLKAAVVYGSIHSKWSVSDMCSVMGCQIDFMEQTSMLEEVVAARGHLARFLPKFHCELNFIKLYWGITKQTTRRRSDMSWYGLQESMWNVFGQPDSLAQSEEDHNKGNKLYAPNDGACVLGSLFLQRASRKTCEFFRMYD